MTATRYRNSRREDFAKTQTVEREKDRFIGQVVSARIQSAALRRTLMEPSELILTTPNL